MTRGAGVALIIGLLAVGCPDAHETWVSRSFDGEEEEALIAAAESVCPNREAVLAVYNYDELGPAPDEGCLWWYAKYNGVRIPYALTRGAIDYYMAKQEQWRGKSPTGEAAPASKSSVLDYSARIRWRETYGLGDQAFEDVYVVTLSLSWSKTGGPLSGHGFDIVRIVVLKADGTVLAVEGDGETPFWVI
jgi:hypothetical protein